MAGPTGLRCLKAGPVPKGPARVPWDSHGGRLRLGGGQEGLKRDCGAACCSTPAGRCTSPRGAGQGPTSVSALRVWPQQTLWSQAGGAGVCTGGCGPGPQDGVDGQDRTGGPLRPSVLMLMASPGDQSTLRTSLGREPGAPSLGLVRQQRGAPDGLGCRAETAVCQSLSQPWALARLWNPGVQDRVSSGHFLTGRRWVTFEHRYQTVLESSQEIQHCPVRCPQRPRCSSARGQGQTPGAHPGQAGPVEVSEAPWEGGLRAPPCSP